MDSDIVSKSKSIQVSRRSFLKKSAVLMGGAIITQNELLASRGETKTIHLYNVHQNRTYNANFYERDAYKLKGLFEVNKAFVDYRAHEMTRIDVDLINLLYEVNLEVGLDKRFNIVSGYRSEKTNSTLAKKMRGVAKNSYHMQGKAVDIYMPDVRLRKIKDIALGLKKGGVGYYPKSNFIHLDVGPVRSWGS